MIINGQTVITPKDDPAAYELDWRYRVAVAGTAGKSNRIPFLLCEDNELQRCVAHIRYRGIHPFKDGDILMVHDRVLGWRDQSTGRLLEAYLLTSEPSDKIAGELGLSTGDVALYEKLFFNVRGPDGAVLPGVLVRLRSEIANEPDEAGRLKRAALRGGVRLLRQLTQSVGDGAGDALTNLVEQELTCRLVTGQLSSRDLTKLQANGLVRERIRSEGADTVLARNEGWMYTLKLLEATKLHMVKREQTAETIAATNSEIQARLRSQRNIQATPIVDDKGKGEEALNELLKKSFKPTPE